MLDIATNVMIKALKSKDERLRFRAAAIVIRDINPTKQAHIQVNKDDDITEVNAIFGL